MPAHHPDKERYPDWTLELKNNLFHKVVTVVQRMKSTPENLTAVFNLICSLFYELLRMLREIDEKEKVKNANPESKQITNSRRKK